MRKIILFHFTFLLFLTSAFGADNDPKQDSLKHAWQGVQKNLSFTLDSRLDFRHIGYKNQLDDFTNDQRFLFSDFRIGLEGKFNKNIGFEFLYSPNDSRVAINKISGNILKANVTYRTQNNHWFFQAGRNFMKVGTIEQSYNPNDVYTYSIIGNNLDIFKTGVTAQYSTSSGQQFGLQVVNANEDSLGNQLNLQYNFYWYGFIKKDKIKTYVSYTYINDRSGLSTNTPYAINIGIQWKYGQWIIDTDYAYALNMPNFQDNAFYRSIPIKVMYNGQKFKPYIKYIYDQIDLIGSTIGDEVIAPETTKAHTVQFALQYYPIADKNLRFHLVGSYSSDGNFHNSNPSHGDERYFNKMTIMAGVRVGFDILKGW
ncbi:hypothetical protein [Flammeovirga sp. SJP92]|uniref:hypothetical protein n=1 Tax=Flammeovirga sp. SJP92 TaxID=1775430 RepID=UPI0012F7909C|nr:hypothetical protein [Flammeovirga sp. SJP92]